MFSTYIFVGSALVVGQLIQLALESTASSFEFFDFLTKLFEFPGQRQNLGFLLPSFSLGNVSLLSNGFRNGLQPDKEEHHDEGQKNR